MCQHRAITEALPGVDGNAASLNPSTVRRASSCWGAAHGSGRRRLWLPPSGAILPRSFPLWSRSGPTGVGCPTRDATPSAPLLGGLVSERGAWARNAGLAHRAGAGSPRLPRRAARPGGLQGGAAGERLALPAHRSEPLCRHHRATATSEDRGGRGEGVRARECARGGLPTGACPSARGGLPSARPASLPLGVGPRAGPARADSVGGLARSTRRRPPRRGLACGPRLPGSGVGGIPGPDGGALGASRRRDRALRGTPARAPDASRARRRGGGGGAPVAGSATGLRGVGERMARRARAPRGLRRSAVPGGCRVSRAWRGATR